MPDQTAPKSPTVYATEVSKYMAATFDRASTACIAACILTPVANALGAPVEGITDQPGAIVYSLNWFFVAAVLHFLGHASLWRLQE